MQSFGRILHRANQRALISPGSDLTIDVAGQYLRGLFHLVEIMNGDFHPLSAHQQFELIAGSLSNNLALINNRNVVRQLVGFF